MIIATLADVLVPIFAGRLVDALADSEAGRESALGSALRCGPRPSRPVRAGRADRHSRRLTFG
jgi:hypothetical protein